MLAATGSVVLGVTILLLAQSTSASDELYRCTDGTFTNRVERQCPPYVSKGIVRVQSARSDGSDSTMKKDEPTQPFAEVKVYQRPAMSETEPRR
jgi:hypothetical protein